MIAKFAFFLIASTCWAFPTDKEQKPSNVAADPIAPPQANPALQGVLPPQGIPAPQGISVPILEGQQPEGQLQAAPVSPQSPAGGKLENSDLKTDNSFWYTRSYYPVIYRRSYYRPRTYTTYSYYTPYYSSWNPYTYYW